MKTDLIIISVAMVLLVFLPFYLLPLLQHRGNQRISKIFKQEAARKNLNLNIKNSWNLNHTGIDTTAQKLLVIQAHDEVKVHHFDLKEIKHTDLLISTLPVTKNGKTEDILQRVEIEFSFYTKEERELLSLYDYDLDTYQDFEVKNAKQLHTEIQKMLMAHTVIKRTA